MEKHRLKIGLGTAPRASEKMDLLKNGFFRKTWPYSLKKLPFVASYTKDNVEVIHFHKNMSVQDLVFVQITFEKCTPNFYFENGEVRNKPRKFSICSLH